MKKYALPFIVAVFVLSYSATASSSTSSSSNNNTKTQIESTSKDVVSKKYNFTLFSFFNQPQKPKADTSLIRRNNTSNLRPATKD